MFPEPRSEEDPEEVMIVDHPVIEMNPYWGGPMVVDRPEYVSAPHQNFFQPPVTQMAPPHGLPMKEPMPTKKPAKKPTGPPVKPAAAAPKKPTGPQGGPPPPTQQFVRNPDGTTGPIPGRAGKALPALPAKPATSSTKPRPSTLPGKPTNLGPGAASLRRRTYN